MILSIGEILADLIGEEVNGNPNFNAFCGGAPFNVIVNAKQNGAKAGFIGCVGKDPIGKFLIEYAKKANLDYLDISVDKKRNTTLAFVTLTNGERDFAFFRHDTADYNINADEIDLNKYKDLSILHLGSLMLSEKEGQEVAEKIVKKLDGTNVLLSFDVNFRSDLYESFETAKKAYKPYIDRADILKFSDDEILLYTGKSTIEEAVKEINKPNRLLLVTMGGKGSLFSYNGVTEIVGTQKITPIDTTGAGDAFFGAFLAYIDGKEFSKENLLSATKKANEQGGKATQFKGAIKL